MTENLIQKISDLIAESITVKAKLLDTCTSSIETCGIKLSQALLNGGKILLCGNGGSAADCQHIAAELVVRFRSNINRPAIPAIALTVDTSILTAGGNDLGFSNVYARGVQAFGKEGDALIAISTSGNSENVFKAAETALANNMLVIGLLGNKGGKIAGLCHDSVIVPSDITPRIQESHILVGHIWCEMIEDNLFPKLFTKKYN